jgi:hypothetical protein
MYVLTDAQPRAARSRTTRLYWVVLLCLASVLPASAQDAAKAGAYTPAIDLLPDSIAGLVRIPNLPRFCEAWDKMHIGQLLDEESMQPFIDAQRARADDYLQSIGSKIGIKVEDLYELASGEVVVSWLPFENDKRRPFALCLVADIRGEKAKADQTLETVDQELKSGGWTREDVQHRGQVVRVYNTKPKPGQLKVEQIAITLDDVRIIASDRDSVVTDLLDAIAGQPKGSAISSVEDFKLVLTRCGEAISEPVKAGGGIIGIEWFARPLQMGRIVRESLQVDRGNQVDILQLLENQGFAVIRAAGGVVAMGGNKYDLLHRALVIAPQDQLQQAARMLRFDNVPMAGIPVWVHEEIASFNRINLHIEEAFWESESLINEAFGDEIFRDIIEGIRDDEDGPQIDIAKNVLPNLDDQVIAVTDNTLPVNVNAERMLVAIRVRDPEAIKTAIRKAMEVEPDASKMEVAGVEIWRVERGEDEDNFDSELFKDLDLGLEGNNEDEQTPPLLDHWAIALVDQGPGSDAPFLMFSNHPDLLVLTATRIQEGARGGLQSEPSIQAVIDSLRELGCQQPAFDRAVRLRLALRAKYELLRQGKLKDSDSVLSSVYRRIIDEEERNEPDPLDATKLPPLEAIEKHLPDGGNFFETTPDGWAITGFLLK